MNSADLLVEFLKSAEKSGSAVKQLDEVVKKLNELDSLQKSLDLQMSEINSRLKEIRYLEHSLNEKEHDLNKEQMKHMADLKVFDVEKFNVKKEKEHAECVLKEVENKIGECEAKMKRLVMEDSRIKGEELGLLLQKKKLDEAMKQMKKLMDDVI